MTVRAATDENAIAHFIVTSLWDDLEAIRAFAGADPEQARCYSEDANFLLEQEPRVVHYDVVEAPEHLASSVGEAQP